MKEYGDKVPADQKAPIENALNKLKEAHKSGEINLIDPAVTELNQAWTAASEEMYKASQGAQPGAENQAHGGPQDNAGENVQDAEFEEVK